MCPSEVFVISFLLSIRKVFTKGRQSAQLGCFLSEMAQRNGDYRFVCGTLEGTGETKVDLLFASVRRHNSHQ